MNSSIKQLQRLNKLHKELNILNEELVNEMEKKDKAIMALLKYTGFPITQNFILPQTIVDNLKLAINPYHDLRNPYVCCDMDDCNCPCPSEEYGGDGDSNDFLNLKEYELIKKRNMILMREKRYALMYEYIFVVDEIENIRDPKKWKNKDCGLLDGFTDDEESN